MIDKSSIKLQKCTDARFVEVYEMHYLENGIKKRWEVVQSNDSVSILINNLDSAKLIIVRQFRPAVFLRNNDGYMFELCAGLVDKKGKSLEQIAREEVYEECGYEARDLQKIGEFYASVGTSGSKQSVFYTEVCNADKKTKGGGVDDEFIEIIEIPHGEVLDFLKTPNITPSLGFAFMWFLVLNSSLGMQFRTCEKFWESTDSGLVLSQNFSQIQKPHRNPKDLRAKRSNQYFDFDSQSESPTKQTQSAESTPDSANQNNPSLRADSQNLRGKPPCNFNNYRLPRSHSLARNDEILDSSLRLRSAQNDNLGKFAESTPDSTNQNNPSLRDSAKQNRGKPPIKKSQNLQRGWLLRNARKSYGLPRSHSLARNDENLLDSAKFAESSAESNINL